MAALPRSRPPRSRMSAKGVRGVWSSGQALWGSSMSCTYIESKSPWWIAATTGRVIEPFVAPNNVVIVADGETFTVEVWSPRGVNLGSWPGFKCEGDELTGTAAANTLLISPMPAVQPTDRNRVLGQWNPIANTEGTWTGNEGGGPREDDTQRG